ncbi:hypothetical protein BMT54_07605 [Pasteurellaceae bacterium 15-036681]|nr:hypothetical protein BMT54_07605 [Pasteurellaceae bacterium 15-036681]
MFNLTTKAYIAVTEAFHNFKKDERGVTAIEYGLIALAMGAVVVLVFGNSSDQNTFIGKLVAKFNDLTSKIDGFTGTGSTTGTTGTGDK